MSNPSFLRRHFPRMAGLALCAAALGACTQSVEVGYRTDNLGPCTAEDSPFEDIPFAQWADAYHNTVELVVDAHLEAMRDVGSKELRCDADDALALTAPSAALQDLAEQLSPWEDPDRLASLSEMDLAPVLLEYLRVYECANLERREQLPVKNAANEPGFAQTPAGAPFVPGETRGNFTDEGNTDRQTIDQELALSRPVLERVLTAMAGVDLVRPLTAEAECVKRISLDFRNVTGLYADASKCLPKAVGKASLRDAP